MTQVAIMRLETCLLTSDDLRFDFRIILFFSIEICLKPDHSAHEKTLVSLAVCSEH